MIMKKPGKPVENDWMTTEEKPEKLKGNQAGKIINGSVEKAGY